VTTETIEGLLDVYDDLAVEIVDSKSSNADVDLVYSNRELAENICRAMDWEDFDLLGFFDFQAIHDEGTAQEILAHAFVSFLRYRLFSAALRRGIGDSEFNQQTVAYSEYWYIKLVHRWNDLTHQRPVSAWMN